MVTIVMSIRGRHIRSMRSGKKRVELRGTRPTRTEGPYRVLLCQSGTGGRIVAAFVDLAAKGYASHVTDWGLDRAPQSWCYARSEGLPMPE